MDWLERLNRGPGQVAMGQGRVEILHWAYAKHLPDNRPHRHTYFEVCHVGAYGQGQYIVQDKPHVIQPGDLFIARPGVIHQIVNTKPRGMELRWVCFQWLPDAAADGDEVNALFRAFAESARVVIADSDLRVASSWQTLQTIADGLPQLGYQSQSAAIITALVLAIAQLAAGPLAPAAIEPTGPDAGDIAARLAVRYIHDNLNLPLPLSEIAMHVYLSPRHLSRVFTRFTGTSPANYITYARMDRARGLLLHGVLSIKEVAAAVGYPDVHHFTRVFTRHYRIPPAEARRCPERLRVPNIQKTGALV